MVLRAIEKRSLPDAVFEQRAAELGRHRSTAGSEIPSERELAHVLSVNRHVIREAVKRLEQIGLVKVTQGGRTRVLDYQRTAGLDLLTVIARQGDIDGGLLPLLPAVLEMRVGIGVDIARLCALRAGSDLGRELSTLADRLAAVARGPEVIELDQQFWQLILDGAENVAYQLAFNSLISAVHTLHHISLPWLEDELQRSQYRRPIAAAIAAGNPRRAVAATRAALSLPEEHPLLGPALDPVRGRR